MNLPTSITIAAGILTVRAGVPISSYVSIVEKTTTSTLNDVSNHIKASTELYFSFHYFTD